MNNTLLQSKLEERCNKLSSVDYGNVEPWQKAEVLNKAQDAWTSRQLEGINQTKTGAEGSIRRIDDLQYILTEWTTGVFTNKGKYWQSSTLPIDYIEWCRISASAQDTCTSCPPRQLVIFMGNESDVDIYLADKYRTPSWAWKTTFATLMSSTVKIWTNNTFDIVNPVLTYYRKPVRIAFINTFDPYTNTIAPIDVECEFPDRITELIIDEAAAILSGDIEFYQNMQRLQQSVEHNT